MSLFQSVGALFKANIVSQVIVVLRTFIVRALLGPQVMGIWDLMHLVLGYVQFFNLGVTGAASRELPYYHGKGEYDTEEEIRSTLFAVIFIEVILASVLFYIYLFSFHEIGSVKFFALLPVPIFAVMIRAFNAYDISFVSLQKFVLLSRIYIITSIVEFLLLCLGTYMWGLYGILIGFGIAMAIRVSFPFWTAYRYNLFRFRPHLYSKKLCSLLKLGIPFEAGEYMWRIFVTIDKVIIAAWLGTTSLAYYMVGVGLYTQLSEFPSKVNTVLSPRIIQKFGETEDIENIKDDVFSFLIGNITVLVPAICVLGVFGGEWIVRVFIPNFTPAIPVIRILIFACFFVPQLHIFKKLFLLKKQLIRNAFLLLMGNVIIATSIWGISRIKLELEYIAWGTVIGYGLFFAVLLFTATSNMFTLKHIRQILGLLGLSFIFTYYLIDVIHSFIPIAEDVFIETILALIRGIFALIFLIPLAIFGLKRINIWDRVYDRFNEKLRLLVDLRKAIL